MLLIDNLSEFLDHSCNVDSSSFHELKLQYVNSISIISDSKRLSRLHLGLSFVSISFPD